MRPGGNGRFQFKKICMISFCLSIIILGAVCCGIGRGIATSTQFFRLSSGQCQGVKASSVAEGQTLTLVVQVGSNITLCVLRASDGVLLKNYDLDVYGDIVGHGDGLLYVNEIGEAQGDSRALCAVRISDGVKLWCQAQLLNVVSTIVDSGNVYTSSSFSDQTQLTSVSESDGRILWSFHTQSDPSLAGLPMVTTGAGIVYVDVYPEGDQSTSGVRSVCAFKSNNGQQLWCKAFGQQTITGLVADENTLYVRTTNASAIYALTSVDGSARWQNSFTSTQSGNRLPGITLAPGTSVDGSARWQSSFTSTRGANGLPGIILASGVVFVEVPEESSVYALSVDNGQQLWHAPDQNSIASIATTDKLIYIMNIQGELQAFNVLDGTPAWSYRSTVAPAESLPTNFQNQIFVVHKSVYLLMSLRYAAYLQALNANDGTAVWADQECTSPTPTPDTLTPGTGTPVASGTTNPCTWINYANQQSGTTNWFLIDG